MVKALGKSITTYLGKKESGLSYFFAPIPSNYSEHYDCEGLTRVVLDDTLKKRRNRIRKTFKTILIGSGYKDKAM